MSRNTNENSIIIPKEKTSSNSRQIVRVENKVDKLSNEKRINDLLIELNETNKSSITNDKNIFLKYQNDLLEMANSPRIKMFYNNDFHDKKIDINDYETMLNSCFPPLQFLRVTRVAGQFLSVSHTAGTEIIMKFFMPYYQYDIEYLRDNRNEISASVLTLINPKYPFYKLRYSSAIGKTNNIQGGEQAMMTYASKYTNSFGFLRTVNFTNTETNQRNLENLLFVVKRLENSINNVDYAYKEIFNYCLDYIAHFYISKKVAPNKDFFTLERLKKYFNMDRLNTLGIFYTEEEIKSHKDLIIYDNTTIGNEMALINKIMENDDDIIQDDIQKRHYYGITNEISKTETVIDSGSLNKHIIPKDYFTVITKLHGYIQLLIKTNRLPEGVDISPAIESSIKNEMKNLKSINKGFK